MEPTDPASAEVTWGLRQILLATVVAVPALVVALVVPAIVVLGLHQVG